MRYEVYETVGDVTKTKEYEGTPEEIAQLIKLLETDNQEQEGYHQG